MFEVAERTKCMNRASAYTVMVLFVLQQCWAMSMLSLKGSCVAICMAVIIVNGRFQGGVRKTGTAISAGR